MNFTLAFLFLFSIILKLFPPKKPNYIYGYQLGSAKKSVEHWKVANKYGSTYLIIIYSVTFLLSVLLDYKNLDYGFIILGVFLFGSILMYFDVERRLKKIKLD